MKPWLFRLVAAAVIVAVALWLWQTIFPSTEKIVLKRLSQVSKLASFTSKEGNITRFRKVSTLMAYFAEDLECVIDAPDVSDEWTVGTREDVRVAVLWSRSNLSAMRVDFIDMTVAVAPNKQTATVELTVRISLPADKDFMIHEMKVTLRNQNGEWLITRIETVKTLS